MYTSANYIIYDTTGLSLSAIASIFEDNLTTGATLVVAFDSLTSAGVVAPRLVFRKP